MSTPSDELRDPRHEEQTDLGPADLGSADVPWHRLHPGTILDDALRRLPSVAIGLFLILTSGGADAAIEVVQLLIGFAAIFPVVVRYLTGRYRIGPDLVQWRVGLITKVHTDLPRHRIQSVDTQISVVGRMLGLQSVVVSSAGGEGEIRIGLIDAPTADDLRSELSPDVRRTPLPEYPDEAAPDGDGTTVEMQLASLDASDLPRVVAVDVGRMLALTLLVIAGCAIFAGMATDVLDAGAIVFGLPLLFAAAGIGRGILTEAIGFSSGIRDDRIAVSRGILARSTVEAPLARVQGVTVKRTIVARRIGTERISLDTADVSDEGNRSPGRSQTLVHPIAEAETWRTWARVFLRGAVPDQDRFERVAPVSLRRRWLAAARLAVALWLVAAGIAWISSARVEGNAVLVVGIGIGTLLALLVGIVESLRYRNERWALGDDQVAFRSGAFTTSVVSIPRIRAQAVSIGANWFQRRLGVANVTVDTASPTVGGSGRDLHLTDAESVARAVIASADEDGGV